MKIFNQSRDAIINMPRDIWTTQCGDGYLLVCSSNYGTYLGLYDTKERADEVLAELFQAYRAKKNSYYIPKE